jgi:hypothetical protein
MILQEATRIRRVKEILDQPRNTSKQSTSPISNDDATGANQAKCSPVAIHEPIFRGNRAYSSDHQGNDVFLNATIGLQIFKGSFENVDGSSIY